ncbi:hypothetical protein FF38_08247 [Lucilia cuprina]|uniref:Uncharacterized protein n=1 Tax=Lucilia cuprina TaxID=7375 RepID=A0A0L0BYP3_LUCCU|nr:hypothetical protein FF38_08247 [Lucilia cuprina]
MGRQRCSSRQNISTLSRLQYLAVSTISAICQAETISCMKHNSKSWRAVKTHCQHSTAVSMADSSKVQTIISNLPTACKSLRLISEHIIKYAVALHNAPRCLASLFSLQASHTSLTKRSASPAFSSSLSTDRRPDISPAYLLRKHKTDTKRGVSERTQLGRLLMEGKALG